MNIVRTLPEAAPNLLREIVQDDVYRFRQAPRVRGGTVIDLGANIGIFSLHALDSGAARVVAVEPFPDNLEMLRENIEASGATGRVAVVDAACVGWHQELAMACAGAQAFCAPNVDWMRRALGQEGPAPRVSTVTLRELLVLHDIATAAFLKVDIEGMEVEVITDTPNEELARIDHIAIEVEAHPPGALGRLVEHLAETHHVEVLGSPRRGCYVYARRYNL